MRGLLVSFVVVVMMAILGLIACTADAESLCWNNQQLALSDQQIVTYDFASLGLPCSTGSYTGNYSIQAFQGNYDVQYGDQLCNTDPNSDRYFEGKDQHYGSGFLYQNQWAYSSNYASFFPKVNVWCRWILGCKIQVSLCMTANLAGSNDAGSLLPA